jgi:hypothetical protein
MLSNEAPGFMIDNLIASGYGDSSMYAVMHYLQPLSGGAIPQWFMDSLAVCPANSDVFTAKLFNFSDPSNNPIGLGEDGTLVIAPIYGRDLFRREGYTTKNDTVAPLSLKLFTKAIGPGFYIDAGSNTVETSSGLITTYYKAFAFAWSLGSTFVLSNEAPGYLIDNLIANGYGDKNLFEVLKALQPVSGGAIPLDFVNQLATCPPGSEIFSAELKNFGGLNNPVCINNDGTLSINPIYGKDYSERQGYQTYHDTLVPVSLKLFTYATGPEYYIDAGSGASSGGSIVNYKAFAIAWAEQTVDIPEAETSIVSTYIYPNPFRERFQIANLKGTAKIEIYSIAGLLLVQSETDRNGFITPDNLPEGLYFLRISTNDEVTIQKIVRQ